MVRIRYILSAEHEQVDPASVQVSIISTVKMINYCCKDWLFLLFLCISLYWIQSSWDLPFTHINPSLDHFNFCNYYFQLSGGWVPYETVPGDKTSLQIRDFFFLNARIDISINKSKKHQQKKKETTYFQVAWNILPN